MARQAAPPPQLLNGTHGAPPVNPWPAAHPRGSRTQTKVRSPRGELQEVDARGTTCEPVAGSPLQGRPDSKEERSAGNLRCSHGAPPVKPWPAARPRGCRTQTGALQEVDARGTTCEPMAGSPLQGRPDSNCREHEGHARRTTCEAVAGSPPQGRPDSNCREHEGHCEAVDGSPLQGRPDSNCREHEGSRPEQERSTRSPTGRRHRTT